MKRTLFLLFLLFFIGAAANAGQPVTDWSREAAQARSADLPILVIFTADDCHYCEQLKRQVIEPGIHGGPLQGKALVREFDIHRGGKITDFDGDRIRSRIFVNRYQVFATPTVVILDGSGAPLTEPLVGFDDAESYRERLSQALDNALIALGTTRGPRVVHHANDRPPAN